MGLKANGTREEKRIVAPTNDLAFKKIFASNENKEILKGFIQDFFEISITDLWVENPYNIEEFNKYISDTISIT